MTGDCNFECSYCYQKRDKKYLEISTAKDSVDFFFPYLTRKCFINFYGGEPLLSFEQIRKVTDYIRAKNKRQKKRIQFSISTNGSLINDDVLRFLDKNRFSVLLSFDGRVQEISRKKGSFSQTVSVVEKLLGCHDIDLTTNSVFTTENVGHLSKSIPFIIESGVPNVDISYSILQPWGETALVRLKKELSSLREHSLSVYRRSGIIPIIRFRKSTRKAPFGCYAGRDRMALSPDGNLWGCFQFYDFFKNNENIKVKHEYCFGCLESFKKNHEMIYPGVLNNYSGFRMDNFFTSEKFCVMCEELEDCAVCPVHAALGDSIIGMVPSWICRIRRIFREEKQSFLRELEVGN